MLEQAGGGSGLILQQLESLSRLLLGILSLLGLALVGLLSVIVKAIFNQRHAEKQDGPEAERWINVKRDVERRLDRLEADDEKLEEELERLRHELGRTPTQPRRPPR